MSSTHADQPASKGQNRATSRREFSDCERGLVAALDPRATQPGSKTKAWNRIEGRNRSRRESCRSSLPLLPIPCSLVRLVLELSPGAPAHLLPVLSVFADALHQALNAIHDTMATVEVLGSLIPDLFELLRMLGG